VPAGRMRSVHKRLRHAALIAPETAWWHDGDQFVEVEIDDRPQCLAGSALLKVFGQHFEPLRILALALVADRVISG